MTFCDKHMEALRRSVNAAGLGDFNTSEAEQNQKLVIDLLMDKPITKAEFNPVVWCQMMISERALGLAERLGIPAPMFAVAGLFEPELACPACHVNHLIRQHIKNCDNPDCPITEEHATMGDKWISMSVEGAIKRLEQLKD